MARPRSTTAKKKAPAKKPAAPTRTVHAESDTVEIYTLGDQWYKGSKRRPELGGEPITIEEAAQIVRRQNGIQIAAGASAAFEKLVG